MFRIRWLTNGCHGTRHHSTGEVWDIPRAEAVELVRLGVAVPVGGELPELATRQPAAETTSKPKTSTKKKT
jgi:hypothetical protein